MTDFADGYAPASFTGQLEIQAPPSDNVTIVVNSVLFGHEQQTYDAILAGLAAMKVSLEAAYPGNTAGFSIQSNSSKYLPTS